MTTARIVTGIAFILFIGLGVVMAFVLRDHFASPQNVVTSLRALGHWAAVAIILLMIVHCFVPFPAEFLAVCAGAIYGTLGGTLLIWIGAMIGALVSFYLARLAGREMLEQVFPGRHLDKLAIWMDEKGAMTLLVSRLIPVIAFNLINYAAGLTRVGTGTFLWTTAVGILPITLLSTWFGAQMKSMSWPVALSISAGLIVMVLWLRHIALRRGWTLPGPE